MGGQLAGVHDLCPESGPGLATLYPDRLGLTSFRPPVHADSSGSLLQLAGDPQHNIFLGFLPPAVLPDIVREQPDIVGISIPTMDQMIAGMTLGAPDQGSGIAGHVTVGGPHMSMLREQLPKVPAIFRLFDSAIVFEGETALLRLAETLLGWGDGDLSKVPEPDLQRERRRRSTCTPCRLRCIPTCCPTLTVCRWIAIWSPRRCCRLLSAHGCYHGKCGFCNVGYGGPDTFHANGC